MKAKPVKLINQQWIEVPKEEATHLYLKFPFDFFMLRDRYIPFQLSGSREHSGKWTWNGEVENPTLKPSILTQFKWGEDQILHRCHSFVNDGKIQFLSDCSHDLVNKTVDLCEVS